MTVRILFVEDEMLIRELAVEDLEDAGFEVVSASTGDEAWALLEAGSAFDVLLTDLNFPGAIDGAELGRRVRSLRPEVPIIYATGYSDAGLTMTERERIVGKPYEVSKIVAILSEFGGYKA